MQHADWLICLVWIQDGGITTNLLRDKLSVWWKTSNKSNICCSKLTLALLWATSLFNPQKCFSCATSWSRKVKNEKHRPKNWNATMLRVKFRAFVSRISPPLANWLVVPWQSSTHVRRRLKKKSRITMVLLANVKFWSMFLVLLIPDKAVQVWISSKDLLIK